MRHPRPARPPRRSGYVHFIGIGPGGEDKLTLGAVAAIEAADEVWLQDLGPPGFERSWLRPRLANKRIINTSAFYELVPTIPRESFYILAARRLVHLAKHGHRIAALVSGAPSIWVAPLLHIADHAATDPTFDLRVTPGVSFVDTMFDRTPLGGVGDLQVRLAGTASRVRPSPKIDCLIGQLGDSGVGMPGVTAASHETLQATLEALYPSEHPVYVVGNNQVDGRPVYAETTVHGLPGVAQRVGGCYWSIVVPSFRSAARLRNRQQLETQRKALMYLHFGCR